MAQPLMPALLGRAAGVAAGIVALAFAVQTQDPVDPVDPAALRAEAEAAEAARDFGKAAKAWQALSELQPDEDRWPVAAAASLRETDSFDRALDLLEAARKRRPASADLAAAFATTCLLIVERGSASGVTGVLTLEDAARVAESALGQHPGRRDLRLLAAQAQMRLGNLEQAIAHAEETTKRFPDHHGGWALLGDALSADFMALRRRIDQERPEGKALQDLLQVASAARERATKAFERATLLDENRSAPWVGLGNLLAWQGNTEQALLKWERALTNDPRCRIDHAWVANNVKTDRRTEWYQNAIRSYLAKPDADPKATTLAGWWLARALYERKKYPEAAALFAQVADVDPSLLNAHAWAMLAFYWSNQHDPAEVQAVRYAKDHSSSFADFVREQPDREQTVAVLEFLARRSFEAGRLAQSRDVNAVLAKVLDTGSHWNNYAFLCRETKLYEQSWQAYEHALSLEPDSPQLLNDAAVILHYHLATPEDLAKAKGMYERAVEQAKATLANADATQDQRDRARQALQDATGNLRLLAARR